MSKHAPAPSRSWPLLLLGAVVGALVVPLLSMEPGLLTGDRLLGAGTADIWGHAWGYWWTPHALQQGVAPWSVVPTNWPAQQHWWVVDLVVAVVLSPVSLTLGAAAAWNAGFVLRLACIGAGLAWWCHREGASRGLSLALVVLVLTGPFVRGLVWSGLPEALSVLLAPVFGGLLGRHLDREGGPVAPALLALFLVGDGLYGAVAAALVGTLELLRRRRLEVWLRALPVVLVSGVGTAGLMAVQRAQGHAALSDSVRPALPALEVVDARWSVASLGGADLLNLVAWESWAPPSPPDVLHRHVVYLGGPLLIAVVVVLIARPRVRGLALLGLAAALLALGGTATMGGRPLLTLPLPGGLLVDAGGAHIYRLAGLSAVTLLLAVGLGTRGLLRWALLLGILVDQSLAFPRLLPTVPNPGGAVEAWLAKGEGAVVDLPLEREHRSTNHPFPQRTFFLQTLHGRPVASAFQRDADLGEQEVSAVRAMDMAVSRGWSSEGRRAAGLKPLAGGIGRRSASQLRELGFTAVVLDLGRVPPNMHPETMTFMEAWLGEPAVRVEDRAAWSLRPQPGSRGGVGEGTRIPESP